MAKRRFHEHDVERQRQLLIDELNKLLRELDRRPALQRRRSGFPFDLMEKSISWSLKQLENLVSSVVAAVLSKVAGRR